MVISIYELQIILSSYMCNKFYGRPPEVQKVLCYSMKVTLVIP